MQRALSDSPGMVHTKKISVSNGKHGFKQTAAIRITQVSTVSGAIQIVSKPWH